MNAGRMAGPGATIGAITAGLACVVAPAVAAPWLSGFLLVQTAVPKFGTG
jgi:hypothetical protein